MDQATVATVTYCMIVFVLGLLVLAAVAYFASLLAKQRGQETGNMEIVREYLERAQATIAANIELGDSYSKHNVDELIEKANSAVERIINESSRNQRDTIDGYLERRNEFSTILLQVAIAITLIVVLAILLLTKTIEPDAGLPILSAVSGFAIAKGISATRQDSRNRQG